MVFIVIFILVLFYLVYSSNKTLGYFIFRTASKIEAQAASLQTCSFNFEKTRICYYDNQRTEKPAVLLLHGFSADKTLWHRFAKQLTNDYRLIIPDLLGHGDTPYKREENYSAYKQAEMVAALADFLNLQDFRVIGNSMGGMIAAILTQNHSERITQAVLLDPAGAKSEFTEMMDNQGHNPFLHTSVASVFQFLPLTMHKRPFVPASVLHYVAQKNYVDKYDQLEHQFADFFNIDEFFSEPFPTHDNQMMVIWGDKDGLLPVQESKVWHDLTGVMPIIYNDIGHMPMVECPERTAADVKKFFAKMSNKVVPIIH